MTPSRLTAFLSGWIADALYVFVAVLRLIPDRRIEPLVAEQKSN